MGILERRFAQNRVDGQECEGNSGESGGKCYYWLDARNRLKIGWDNSPHHKRLENFPHHKHIGEQAKRVVSYEVCLEDVMTVLEKEIGRSK